MKRMTREWIRQAEDDFRSVAAEGDALTDLGCDFRPERDAEILRSLKILSSINGKPAAAFWKEVDEKKLGK